MRSRDEERSVLRACPNDRFFLRRMESERRAASVIVACEGESSMSVSSSDDRFDAFGVRVGVGESCRDLLSFATISEIYASKTEPEESGEESRGQRESSLWENEIERSNEEPRMVPLGDVGEKIRGSMVREDVEGYRGEGARTGKATGGGVQGDGCFVLSDNEPSKWESEKL